MLYRSEITGKDYKSEKECLDAEKAHELACQAEKAEREKKDAERKAMAQKVEAAHKEMVAAQHKYREELDAFIRKYKTYHFTSTSADDFPTLFGLMDFFNVF